MITKENDAQTPWEDPIVAEVRRVRETLYADSGYNLHELGRRLHQKQELSGRIVVSRSSRPPSDTDMEAKSATEQSGHRD
jgi:hypothetical protein